MLGVLRPRPPRCGVPEENLRNAGKDQQTLVDYLCVDIFELVTIGAVEDLGYFVLFFVRGVGYFLVLFFWEVVKIMAGLTISRIIVQIASKAA